MLYIGQHIYFIQLWATTCRDVESCGSFLFCSQLLLQTLNVNAVSTSLPLSLTWTLTFKIPPQMASFVFFNHFPASSYRLHIYILQQDCRLPYSYFYIFKLSKIISELLSLSPPWIRTHLVGKECWPVLIWFAQASSTTTSPFSLVQLPQEFSCFRFHLP